MPRDINPLPSLSKLQTRVREKAKDVGLVLQQFVVIPADKPDGTHTAQMIFTLDETFTEEKDEEFQAIIEGAAEAEREARIAKGREDALKLKQEIEGDFTKGIGLDD